ncbi:hypothetical protein [Chryseobacterium sp. MP_3.2]|uniref:hypothetical protein n=1 Tax=Chryseobacterium sp. MP_3.2 TaxID=3071712 RepID=UPI002DF91809|nr:hypothetical protein [Chryseobacterium sp. MP_3.2]
MTEFIFKVKKDIITIKKQLTNVENFVNFHPLIYKITDLGGNKYMVFERIKMDTIPYRFTYKAIITDEKDSVNVVATFMGLTTISMFFTFQEEDKFTVIKERLVVKSPFPTTNYMNRLIEKQHKTMFNNIELI